MTDSRDEGLLKRWSRRKREAGIEEGAAVDPEVQIADGLPVADPAVPDEAVEAEREANRVAAEAIDLESIGYDSDLSPFFRDGVPKLLKQAALRKMWASSPLFANLDGLNDYDHDYNVIDKVLTKFESAWQVGRGYRTDESETNADEADAEVDATETGHESVAVEETPKEEDGEPEPETVTRTDDQDVAPAETSFDEDLSDPDASEMEERPVVSIRRRLAQFETD